jgi:hypothetical protein
VEFGFCLLGRAVESVLEVNTGHLTGLEGLPSVAISATSALTFDEFAAIRCEPFVQARFRGTVWHDSEETEDKQKGNRRIQKEDNQTLYYS